MLLEMLKYCRPEGSTTQQEFCKRFLEPIMGKPDGYGNYVLEVGDEPTIAFMAHHDTVHKEGGYQKIEVSEDGDITSNSNCLGADCTTGVWLILEMIKAQVPGVYVVHAAEEVGCKGSSALVASNPAWLSRISVAMSFDRWGTQSVITHQMGRKTASDEFAHSVADVLNLDLEPDPGGSYTDSNEYVDIVPECTNISVGYYNQHTKKERQDSQFAITLRDALITADWSNLVIKRDPSVIEYDEDYYGTSWSRRWATYFDDFPGMQTDPMTEIVAEYPGLVADMLRDYGFDSMQLMEELDLNFGDLPQAC